MVLEKVRNDHWSLDACVGYVRRHRLFKLDRENTFKAEEEAGVLYYGMTDLSRKSKGFQLLEDRHRQWY